MNRREINKKFLRDIRTVTPCRDCERHFPWYVMEFDHVRGEHKYRRQGMAAMAGMSLPTLFEELDKCDVVCANCHKVRTYERRQQHGRRTTHPPHADQGRQVGPSEAA